MRNVTKEEFVLLTMNRNEALILSQLLYWTPRTKDYKQFLTEEEQRLQTINYNKFNHGWIYKTADELKFELLMIDTNVKTLRKDINNLIEKGYILRRRNPVYKFDKTYQYRIN